MDAWIIILVTILSGLALFSLIFFCAKRRAAKRTRRQAIPVTVTVQGAPGFQSQQMMTHVPSTSYSPAYNSNMPTMVIEQPARIGHRQEFVMVQQSQPMMIQQPQPNIQYYTHSNPPSYQINPATTTMTKVSAASAPPMF